MSGNWELQLNARLRKMLLVVLGLAVCGVVFHHTWGVFLAAWITWDAELEPAVYERAIQHDPSNANYHFVLGQIYQYSTPYLDPEKAAEHLVRAAELNPNRAAHWRELSSLREGQGDVTGARTAMEKALEVDPNHAEAHWAAANLHIRLGDLSSADLELRRAGDLDVGYLTQILDLVWRFYGDPALILTTHVPNTKDSNLTALNFFIGQGSVAGAAEAWDRLRMFETEAPERFHYVDFLVGAGQPHEAYGVFLAGSDQTPPLFNGGFESGLLNGGFDWRYGAGDHADLRRDTTQSREGFASLLIQFDGEANLDYGGVWHWLAVQPGQTYQLRFSMRSQAISTDEGVYVEVDGQTSDAVLGTTSWQEFAIRFEASADLVTVRVRRNPSQKFDNLLGGQVWLDGFELSEE